MKTSLKLKLVSLATTVVSAFTPLTPAAASQFGQTEVDQQKFAVIASPIGQTGNHQLLIVEQIASSRQCWSESGSNPIIINPLLLSFDFSGVCGRSTDSNGYSIRVAGEDIALQYGLRVIKRDGEMFLMGVPFRASSGNKPLEIGRTYGLTSDFAKFILNPGWRITKRNYDGKVLGHMYLTNDLTLSQLTSTTGGGTTGGGTTGGGTTGGGTTGGGTTGGGTTGGGTTGGGTTGGGTTGGGTTGGGTTGGGTTGGGTETPPILLSDIRTDIYVREIEEAVKLGFVSGFPDNTFRPKVALTREQLVSMVLEAMKKLPGANLSVPSTVSTRPYSDVETTRWSASKILWARTNNIVSGYPDGTFRPDKPVTRAEMMAVLRRAAEYGKSLRGLTPTLTQKQPPLAFTDTTGHWANALVTQMSGYCGVASPLNEVGNRFEPDAGALRNYAAAATLRTVKCIQAE
jgi:N-acetylmuramoyl-L-alanine amidase